MIKEAKEQTRNAQLHRMEGRRTRGTGYKVGDLVRIKLDSNEIKKRGKKLAKRYSEKYMVIEVIGGGWIYKPYGRWGRNKIRHFNDLKDATIRRKEMKSSDGEVLAEMESKTQSSGHKGRLRRSTRKRTTTKRLQLNVVLGKRYAEKEVEIMPENEQSESESDYSFVTVGENSFVEVSTRRLRMEV